MKELKVSKKSVGLAIEKIAEVEPHLEKIDALIKETSLSYDFDRIQEVEKNVLRLAVFEMLYDASIPEKVAISEAIRLCKKFSTKESSKFVNALLDKILKNSNKT
jgi:transcription antitermination protein NusB